MSNLNLSDDEFQAFLLVCESALDTLKNDPDPNSLSVKNSIRGFNRLLELQRTGAPFGRVELSNIVRACDTLIPDMRSQVSFVEDAAMREQMRVLLRGAQALRSKVSDLLQA